MNTTVKALSKIWESQSSELWKKVYLNLEKAAAEKSSESWSGDMAAILRSQKTLSAAQYGIAVKKEIAEAIQGKKEEKKPNESAPKFSFSLVEEDDLEKGLAVSSGVATLNQKFAQDLFALEKRWEALKESGAIAESCPWFPQPILDGYERIFSSFNLPGPGTAFAIQIALKTFLSGSLKEIYDALNQQMVDGNILPEIKWSVKGVGASSGASSLSTESADPADATPAESPPPLSDVVKPIGEFAPITSLASAAGLLDELANSIVNTAGQQAYPPHMPPALAQDVSAPAPSLTQMREFVPAAPVGPNHWMLPPAQPERVAQHVQAVTAQAVAAMGPKEEWHEAMPVPSAVAQQIKAEYEKEGATERLGEDQQKAIDLVTLIFEALLEDDVIPVDLRALLGRLQLPYVRLALVDAELEKETHPARKILEEWALAGRGYNEDVAKSQDLLHYVRDSLEKILQASHDSVQIFDEELNGFLQWKAAWEKKNAIAERRTIETREGQELVEKAHIEVVDFLAARAEDKGWDLHDPWWAKMLEAYFIPTLAKIRLRMNKGVASAEEDWQRYSEKIDALLSTTASIKTGEEGVALIRNSPHFENLLIEWVSEHHIQEEQKEEIVQQFKGWLRNQIKATNGQPKSLPTLPLAQDDAAADDSSAATGSPAGMILSTSLPPPPPAKPLVEKSVKELLRERNRRLMEGAIKAPSEDHEELQKLKLGDWVEFRDPMGSSMRGKLSLVTPYTERYFFTSQSGSKLLELSKEDLIKKLDNGTAHIVPTGGLFQRALVTLRERFKTDWLSKNTLVG